MDLVLYPLGRALQNGIRAMVPHLEPEGSQLVYWNEKKNKNKENEIFQETLIRIKNGQDSTMSPLIFPSSSMFLRFMLITCISFSGSLDDIPSARAQSNALE